MKKLILIAILFLIPSSAFSAGAVNCNDIPNCQCRDVCQSDEYIITKIKVMSGEHKDEIVSVFCDKEKIDPNKVCCTKKSVKSGEESKIINFPEQIELSNNGYWVLLGSFIFWFVVVTISERFLKKKESIDMGYGSIAFCALFAVTVTNIALESYINKQFYTQMFGNLYLTTYILAGITFIFGVYCFVITWGWAFYKFYFKNEITDFMFSVIEFAENVKKMTKI